MISQLIMAAALSVGPNIGDVRLRGPARLKHLDCPKVPCHIDGTWFRESRKPLDERASVVRRSGRRFGFKHRDASYACVV